MSNHRMQRMQQLSAALTQALRTRETTEDLVKLLRATFPHAAYVSITSVSGRGNAVELIEHYNFVQAGPLMRDAYFATLPSVAAEAISCNQNKYYDESVHRAKLANARDFQRASAELDCASIVCVPLPCHSRLVPVHAQATVNKGGGVHCLACHRRMDSAARPLGCITLGIKRKVNFSIREYLAKTLVLAGFIGPRVLRLSGSLNSQLPSVSEPLAAMAALQASQQQQQAAAAAALAAAQQQLQQQQQMGMALQSSWYTGPTGSTWQPPLANANSAPSGMPPLAPGASVNAMTALSDNLRRLSVDADAFRFSANGRASMDAEAILSRASRLSMDTLLAAVADTRMSLDSSASVGLPPHVQAALAASGGVPSPHGTVDLPLLRNGVAPAFGGNARLSLDSQSSSLSGMQLGEYLLGSSRSNSIDVLGCVASSPAFAMSACTAGPISVCAPFPGMSTALQSHQMAVTTGPLFNMAPPSSLPLPRGSVDYGSAVMQMSRASVDYGSAPRASVDYGAAPLPRGSIDYRALGHLPPAVDENALAELFKSNPETMNTLMNSLYGQQQAVATAQVPN